MIKICRFDGCRCYRSSCDSIRNSGDVVLCHHHRNPSGRFTVGRGGSDRV